MLLPKTKFFNLLSTTEAGDVTCCELTREMAAEMELNQQKVCAVGYPIWNVSVKLIPHDVEDQVAKLNAVDEN